MREDSPWHRAALACVRRLAEGPALWAIAWPCVHEFLAVMTHPRIYKPPTPLEDAVLRVDYWMGSPTLRLLGEGPGYWARLKEALRAGKAAGPLVHDARVGALCQPRAVRELWSADQDHSRFPGLRVRNPRVSRA